MQKNIWSTNFDWVKVYNEDYSGYTYYQQDRLEQYNQDRFIAVDSIYFKFNKYLDGVCFSYINNLNDIYRRDLLNGDGYSIFNMYNEYDVVDRVTKNWVIVDVASNININLNQQWIKIDNFTLKPGHLVLLYNQDLESQNDVYRVTSENFLENAGYLTSREKSEKFACSVKTGTDGDKQFFLLNNGYDFPVIFEPKCFIEGKSIILKNKIRYDLFNGSGSTSKIIFTDYDFSRKQFLDPYKWFDNVTFGSDAASSLNIKYHHDEYSIKFGSNNFITGLSVGDISGSTLGTIVSCTGLDFILDDAVQIKMYSGSTEILSTNTFIYTGVSSSYLVIEDEIPNRILNGLSTCTYDIRNLNVVTNWNELIDNQYLDNTPYSDFFDYYADTGITFYPKESRRFRYFDYEGLSFDIDGGTYNNTNFDTIYPYLKYKLFDRLNEINSSIFTSLFSGITGNYSLTSGFSREYINSASHTSAIRIVSDTILTGFTPYTYVSINSTDITSPQITLIYSVNNYEMVIEKPRQWCDNGDFVDPSISSIYNIDNLSDISYFLDQVYINTESSTPDWYIHRSDNERKYICKAYAELLTHNKLFRDNVTGILYENNNNEFILKLYDIENDSNLYFETVELMYLGSDKKTRLPVPFKRIQSNRLTSTDDTLIDWNVLDGGWYMLSGGTYASSPYTYEVFDFGFNNVLGGPNDPATFYNLIDGNDG
jgi:hypothetical protein